MPTKNKGLEQPANGTFVNTWDEPVNGNFGIIDKAFGGVYLLNATGVASPLDVSSTNAQNLIFDISGLLGGNFTLRLPRNSDLTATVGGQWIVRNTTTGSSGGVPFTVTISPASGGGTSVVIPQGQTAVIFSDGTNIRTAPSSTLSGSTVISGIPTDAILYNNDGVLAGVAASGTGNVVLVNEATLTDPTIDGATLNAPTISNAASVRVGTTTTVSGLNEAVSVLCAASTGGVIVRLTTNTFAYFAGYNANGLPTFSVNGTNVLSGPDLSTNAGFSGARARFVNNTDWAGEFYNYSASSGGNGAAIFRVDNISNALIGFSYASTGLIGAITTNGSSVSYNTSSDRRLKDNIEPVPANAGLALLDQLRPVTFEWISSPDLGKVMGFIADEVQQVAPQAVTGEPDAVDADGKPIYQGVDMAKLVPVLTAALQDASRKIDALTARVAALEAKS